MPFIYPNIYALNIQLIRTVTLHAALGIKLYLSCRVKSLRIICGRANLRLLGYKPMRILLRYRVPVSWTESSWYSLQVLEKLFRNLLTLLSLLKLPIFLYQDYHIYLIYLEYLFYLCY